MPNLRSPSIVINEIELSVAEEGVPSPNAVIVGTSKRGRAFVPHTVGTQAQLLSRFGEVTPETPGLHGAFRFLESSDSCAFVRLLGAGDFSGFKVDQDDLSSTYSDLTDTTTNFFLFAEHDLTENTTAGRLVSGVKELEGLDGSSDSDKINLLRAQIIMARGWTLSVGDLTDSNAPSFARETDATTGSEGLFKLFLTDNREPSSPIETEFVVSLDPASDAYIGRVLNGNPEAFADKGHVLWREWPVDSSVARVNDSGLEITLVAPRTDALNTTVSGQTGLEQSSATVNQALGRWEDQYRDSVSPWVTSQPSGAIVDENANGVDVLKLSTKRLFRFHTIDDGTASAEQVKITISNVRASTNDADPYGSFTVEVRRWNDTDFEKAVLETFPSVNLNPNSERYIARVIGDSDIFYDWSRPESERRLVLRGTYSNRSDWVWVEMHPDVDEGKLDASILPFGYESPTLQRLNADMFDGVSGPLNPLAPTFRKKLTVGGRNAAFSGLSQSAKDERLDRRLSWGLQWERNRTGRSWNERGPVNGALRSLCSYLGSGSLSQLVKGKEASELYASEFSLAQVTLPAETVDDIRSLSPASAARSAYYVRGNEIVSVDSTRFIVEADDGSTTATRITLGTLLVEDPRLFNRYTAHTAFTIPLQGGWDGTNPFWKESANLSDKASGLGENDEVPGFGDNVIGWDEDNIVIQSLVTIAKISLGADRTTANVVATPGYREELVFDEYADTARNNGFLLYVGDVPAHSEEGLRIWTGERTKPDLNFTLADWSARNVDNSFAAVYYPDVVTSLPNGRGVVVPASVAGLSAIAFNDLNAYPWFAPAGFNRGALPWVRGTVTKLRKPDRDELYDDARINPIFSGTETDNTFAILGQKTLQLEASALDRINVRRAVIEAKVILKRNMIRYGLFELNDAQTRNLFVQRSLEQLEPIKQLAGARKIEVICDESNNPPEDVRNRIIRATCSFVPVRVAENIVLDVFVSPDGDFSFLER